MSHAPCKHEGCTLPARGRGMCINHYQVWKRQNPGVTVMATNEKSILDCMPATRATIMELTGLCYKAVQRALDVMMNCTPRRCHIEDWEEPTTMGTRWIPIFAAGPGEDVVITKKQKAQHRLRGQRDAHARRTATWKATSVQAGGGWAAPLLGGAMAQREYMPSMRQKGIEDEASA